MFRAQKHSISGKLTWMNILVSGAALLLACAAFIAFDMITFRQAMLRNLSTQAQIIGFRFRIALRRPAVRGKYSVGAQGCAQYLVRPGLLARWPALCLLFA